ncbi:zinc-binding dehydrogenase [Halocatena pleomorpha]|uniref:Alcohol dehydrogenase n=1 Tax=Halocatena pleomorpha TaxID=1785090 RepID=A0A3P3RAK5_9EURY|nr:zinc-binding dehydrogenase [Halocatena pleomorpha]RRJ30511.1 alcohol dehydrogenase [Halocatena pleomorpha]
MKAVQFTEHGDRSVLSYEEHPDPEISADEVLIDVKAAALNHLDVHTRRGLPGVDLAMPHIPGSDAAGVVTETGSAVSRFSAGDRVAVSAGRSCGTCEYCRHGQYSMCESFHLIGEHVSGVHAELAAVPADNLVPVPETVDWPTAGSAALVFQTAWRMLHTQADLAAGEHVLVHGASGGVGHAAVQIAAHAGAVVYATASSETKLDHARDCGADHCINYDEASFTDEIYALTDGRGVDIVVDHVGPATWDDSLKSLAKGGRLVTCGATTGPTAETNINRVFWNQLRIIGSTMATPGETDDVLSLVWDGTFNPQLRTTLPMSDIARAHELLEEREGFGKVVVVPDSEMKRSANNRANPGNNEYDG